MRCATRRLLGDGDRRKDSDEQNKHNELHSAPLKGRNAPRTCGKRPQVQVIKNEFEEPSPELTPGSRDSSMESPLPVLASGGRS